MAYTDFDKLKTFFLALNKSGYRPERMDPKIITPKDKAYCFNLLREKIPELKDKTDNDLIEFLKDPKKVKERILGKFAVGEGFELTKILDEKPIIAEGVGGQPSDQAAPAEIPPAGTGGSWGGGMPSMPSITAPAIHPVYRTKPPVPEPPKPDIIKPTSRFNFSSKSRLSNFAKKAQNFAGRANPWLKTNLGRVGRGLTQSVLPSGANFLGRTGLKAINYGGNFLSNLSNARSRLSTTSKSLSPKNLGPKRALLIFGAVSFLIFFMGALGGMGGNTSTGEAAPIDSTAAPPYQPGAGKGIISCPLNQGAAVVNDSINSTTEWRHCGPKYVETFGDKGCIKERSDYTGKDTAIDITSPDQRVYLPKVEDADKWEVVTDTGAVIIEELGGGIAVAATTKTTDGTTYRIRFVHIASTSLKIGDIKDAGTEVGKYYQEDPNNAHVHITIQKNSSYLTADKYFNLCSP